jgi:hypothetical protein
MRLSLGALSISFLASSVGPAAALAQDALPVLRARSKVVTIIDGAHVKKNYWYVMPERVPDVYYVEIPLEPHTVTFTTDVASMSFPVTYGSRHTFVIRLEDGTEARTEVRAAFRHDQLISRRTGPAPPGGVDTIPFTLGDNDKIYVKGRINGGPLLDMQVDLGSGGTLIKKASVAKVTMTFDGTITLQNSDGVNVVPSSSANRLEIAGLTWDRVSIAVADNMTRREDVLIGNRLFQDKVLEIDYDRMLLGVHETSPALPAGWTKQEIVLDGGVVPFIRGSVTVAGRARSGWFMLDTGAYTSILNGPEFTPTSKMTGELRRLIGGDARSPTLAIRGHAVADPNFSVRLFDGDLTSLGLLGNDVLKRFNLILDNRRGVAYVRPNGRQRDAFMNPEYYVVRLVPLLLAVAGMGIVWLVRRRRRTNRPLRARDA